MCVRAGCPYAVLPTPWQAESHFPPIHPDKRTKLVHKHRVLAAKQAYLDRKRTGQVVDLDR